MTSCRHIAALGASFMCSLTGCSVPAEPTSDWHPSSVSDDTIASAGTPPPWKSPDSRPDPFGITAGPDGNIWFTESEFNRIGKLTPDGHITQFPLPVDDDVPDMHPEPVDIVCGGDGALWFAALTGLGRSTTDGRIRMYPDAGDLTEDTLSHIAPARDGVWVLHVSLGHVGKNGVLTWYKRQYDPRKWMQSICAGPPSRLGTDAQDRAVATRLCTTPGRARSHGTRGQKGRPLMRDRCGGPVTTRHPMRYYAAGEAESEGRVHYAPKP